MSDNLLPFGPDDEGNSDDGGHGSRHAALAEKRRSRRRTRRVLVVVVALFAILGVGAVVAWQAVSYQVRRSIEWLEDPFEALPTRPPVASPSAPGEAPEGLGFTGEPAFNLVWTSLHVPCVTVPVGRGPHGLPLGIQVVGPRGADAQVLAWARWVQAALG